jgi:hypothetical protein
MQQLDDTIVVIAAAAVLTDETDALASKSCATTYADLHRQALLPTHTHTHTLTYIRYTHSFSSSKSSSNSSNNTISIVVLVFHLHNPLSSALIKQSGCMRRKREREL